MATILIGTHALAQTTIQLPNPGWNNDRNRNRKVKWHQTASGRIYSYVQGTTEQAIHLDFLLAEGKAEELNRFFKVYSTELNRMYDYNGVAWTFRFLKKDLTFTTQFRGEMKQVTLEILAKRIT